MRNVWIVLQLHSKEMSPMDLCVIYVWVCVSAIEFIRETNDLPISFSACQMSTEIVFLVFNQFASHTHNFIHFILDPINLGACNNATTSIPTLDAPLNANIQFQILYIQRTHTSTHNTIAVRNVLQRGETNDDCRSQRHVDVEGNDSTTGKKFSSDLLNKNHLCIAYTGATRSIRLYVGHGVQHQCTAHWNEGEIGCGKCTKRCIAHRPKWKCVIVCGTVAGRQTNNRNRQFVYRRQRHIGPNIFIFFCVLFIASQRIVYDFLSEYLHFPLIRYVNRFVDFF